MPNWARWFVASLLCIAAHSTFAAPRASASCEAPQSCVCERWPAVHVFQARFDNADDGLVSVEVLDVLATDETDPVRAGEVVEGTLEVDTCGVQTPEFESGSEVLAVWRGWPRSTLLDCPEYAECVSGVCAPSTEGESCTTCLESARIECPRTGEPPRLVLVPWDAELQLGEGRVLSSDEAGLLGDRNQCLAVFPPPPPPPCDDVILVGVDDGCSVAAPGATARGGILLWLLVAIGAVVARRRRVPR